ncbi:MULTISPECIES: recombinase family protein [Pseudomonas]|uniref:recombinase family protein n=1 Tax=Pseudomonas TaxID=286 RepID=UPI001AE8ACCD|nr:MULTISPECIES: recombinase family protein [Pseudomonas]MBP2083511.1 DNA invertase Pin-like site-specific DNA recombinase [Pseudomonas sp. PvP089]MBP2090786.1 DNA invertase Pin-like site-specific DNA recombinase [Pseudomonas sp. PvP088]MBP2223050.1 DNA invertase Pin-like site-specific DNA recombinase [Pseudomonas putida]
MDIGYIRVSSTDQNTARQLDGVKLDEVFTDKVSGGTVQRPQLAALRRSLRAGDTLHVHSIDRLARSLSDLLALVEEFRTKGVVLRFHKENLTFTGQADPMQDLMLSMMGAVAQFERAIIRERQAEGIAKAKANGVYVRRAEDKSNAKILELRDAGISIRDIAANLGIGVSTVQRVLKAARG